MIVGLLLSLVEKTGCTNQIQLFLAYKLVKPSYSMNGFASFTFAQPED